MTEKRLECLAPLNQDGVQILILGSMPSEMSLLRQEYYGNPQNDFWRIISAIFNESHPLDYSAKKEMLERHRIGLWDVFASCQREGSLDSNLKVGVVNEIPNMLSENPGIKIILLNGKKAAAKFDRHFSKSVTLPFVYVPSSSRALTMKFSEKVLIWKEAIAKE